MSRKEKIQQILERQFSITCLEVIDISAEHHGHAGYSMESHFQLQIGAKEFQSLGTLQSHSMVYKALHSVFGEGLHSLSIKIIQP